jgi:hypothetical protein
MLLSVLLAAACHMRTMPAAAAAHAGTPTALLLRAALLLLLLLLRGSCALLSPLLGPPSLAPPRGEETVGRKGAQEGATNQVCPRSR